jgi:uncharacterized protein YdbL (DUF1318 family)
MTHPRPHFVSRRRSTRLRPTLLCPLALLTFGCVTINLYFPEAEIRDAAEQIVEEVRPDIGETEGAYLPTHGSAPGFALFPTAYAAEKKLKTDSTNAVVKRILAALKKRFAKLIPYFRRGALGEGYDGYLALRDYKSLNLKEQRDVKALLAAENKDRKNLYAEIAKLNGVEKSRIKDVASIFGEKWREKCKPGWWIEPKKKKWEKKKKEKKKKNSGKEKES